MQEANTYQLGDIAQIIPGKNESNTKRVVSGGYEYTYIQPIHLTEWNSVVGSDKIRRQKKADSKTLLRQGDLIVRRVNPSTINLVLDPLPDTMVSANLFIVRPHEGIVPEYLACLLEQGISLAHSHMMGTGDVIQSVSKRSLSDTKIPLPPIHKQQLIGGLWLLAKRRRKLLMDLAEKENQLINAAITTALKDEEER